jgi:hypothetical protein
MTDVELRAMVREVLREALARRPAAAAPGATAAAGPTSSPAPVIGAVEPVRIGDDADLAAFVRRLVALLDDPATGPAVRAGRHRFALAATATAVALASPAATLTGTVTEAAVAKLKDVTRVRLADGAVVTPLARDRMRAMGIVIEGRR